ncbi:MAG: 3'-5' exonuclease [Candidatus Obscuribacter sp.]|nr:3'-5' exonuclease [Candidatus Obscuribacter sp.]
MLLKDLPVLIIDCQTTGASPQYGQILELGWSHYQPATDQDEPTITTRLIKQPVDTIVPERIKKITGITDSDMESAHSPIDVISELAAVVSASSASPLLAVAHWAQFEQSFISDFYATHDNSQLPFSFVCTCQIAKRLFPDLPSRAFGLWAVIWGSLSTKKNGQVGMSWPQPLFGESYCPGLRLRALLPMSSYLSLWDVLCLKNLRQLMLMSYP